MTTNTKRPRIAKFLFLWLLKTETDFTTGCLSATKPARFEWSRSKCPFRFSFLTEAPQTGHFSVSNATFESARVSQKPIGYVATTEPFDSLPVRKTRIGITATLAASTRQLSLATYSSGRVLAAIFEVDDRDDLVVIAPYSIISVFARDSACDRFYRGDSDEKGQMGID